MNIALLIWLAIIIACILEAYFCSQFDPESKRIMKKREDEQKNNNLHE